MQALVSHNCLRRLDLYLGSSTADGTPSGLAMMGVYQDIGTMQETMTSSFLWALSNMSHYELDVEFYVVLYQ